MPNFRLQTLPNAKIFHFSNFSRIGGDWTEICKQPELKLSSALDFNPESTEKVTLPAARPIPKVVRLHESELMPQDTVKSPSQCQPAATTFTETTPDAEQLPTELNKSVDQPSTCSKEEPTSSVNVPDGTDDRQTKTVFVFSIENVPSDCYYLTHPNKYVFPGSTHTWYGSGNPDKDRDEIFEDGDEDEDEFVIGYDDDDDDDDEDDDDDDDAGDCEDDNESSANQCENSDSNDIADDAPKSSDAVLLGKRVGSAESVESVSPLKQQKANDE